jgi:branched-chain amino acid transport system substrate-binding protein
MKCFSRMLFGAMLLGGAAAAQAAEPIKIGFSMELTGPFAVVGKTGLLAFKIWEDEVNAEGGLLGRPVKLVYYDDQSNPSLVPAIYTKLIDIDKVDLLISSYGTNLVVPAMPVAISHNRLFFGLFALAANDNFHYPKYFSMLPFGPEPVKTFAEGWFDLAAAQNPKPKTVAIVATDAEFQHRAARKRARARQGERDRHGVRPGLSADHGRLHADRSRRTGGPAGFGLYHLVSVRHGRHPAFGRRTRPQRQNARRRPCRTAGGSNQDAARRDRKRHRQCRFVGAGPDNAIPRRHGFHQEIPGEGAGRRGRSARLFPAALRLRELQILGDAIAATKTLDDDKLAEYLHSHPFRTIEGDIAFGPDGEWTQARPIWVQYHDIKGHDVEQFRGPATVTILAPAQYKTGDMMYPYTEARK